MGCGVAVQDVLVMMQEPVVPMCFMRVRCIGVMHMIDQGEQDDKIIAVHIDDPEYKHITDISQVPKHRLAEIRCAPPQVTNVLVVVLLYNQTRGRLSSMVPRSRGVCRQWWLTPPNGDS